MSIGPEFPGPPPPWQGSFTPPDVEGPTMRFPGLSMGVMQMLIQMMQQRQQQQMQMQQQGVEQQGEQQKRQYQLEDADAAHDRALQLKMIDQQGQDRRQKAQQSRTMRPKRKASY